MINLLPRDIKQQYAYSRKNTILRWVIVATIIVGVLSSALVMAGNWYVSSLAKAAESDLVTKQSEISKYKKDEQRAKQLNTQIEAIADASSKTTKFSEVILKIRALLPAGSYVETINLDGKAESPLQLGIIAKNKTVALNVHDAFADSEQFSHVDIMRFSKDSNSKDGKGYVVDINLGYSTPAAAYGPPGDPVKPVIKQPAAGVKK